MIEPKVDTDDSAALDRSAISGSFLVAGLVSAVIIGLVLRIDYIHGHYLWTDETTTRFYMGLSWEDFARWFRYGRDFHPPLYFAWLRSLLSISSGLAEIQTLRYLDLVWLPSTIAVLGWIGFRRPRLRAALIVSSLLVAAGPTFVYLGAELRSYGLFLFLAAALTVLAIEGLDSECMTRGRVVLMATVALLLSFTHYTGLLVVGAITGSAVIAAVIMGRPWRRFVIAGASAFLGFLSHAPALLNQLHRRESIYSTSLAEAREFLLRGFGPIGWGVIVLAIGAAAASLLSRRPNSLHLAESRLGSSRFRDPGFMVPTLAVALFMVGVGSVAVITGVDLLNFGVSIVPSFLLVLSAGVIAASVFERATVALLLVTATMSITLSFASNQDPSIFEGNRVSTMDIFSNALFDDPSLRWAFGSGLTIVHVDWDYPNDYFSEQAEQLVPRAQIEALSIPEYTELANVLERVLTDKPRRILIVTRLPLDTRILPQIPPGVQPQVINENLVELTFDP